MNFLLTRWWCISLGSQSGVRKLKQIEYMAKPGGGVKKKFSDSGLPGGLNLSGPCGSILRYTKPSQRPYKSKSEK